MKNRCTFEWTPANSLNDPAIAAPIARPQETTTYTVTLTDLRGELEALGRTFTTDSDTEVVLQAFAQWGADAFDRFNGMFGLAIWDRHEQRLTLARDHFGIKPLYVAMVPNPSGEGEALLFSSEIKPILASGLYEKRVNDFQG